MRIAGVDPGLSGGVAILNGNQADVCPMPTIPTGKGNKRELDVWNLAELLRTVQFCVVERQQAYPQQGGVSNFTTGAGFGAVKGILAALAIPMEIVSPRDWRRAFGIPNHTRKEGSIAVAKRLFPTTDLRATPRCRTDHDGMAEALLLAEFGRRILPNHGHPTTPNHTGLGVPAA